MPDAAWRAPGRQFKGTFSAVLHETNRFPRTDNAVPARRFRLVKTLVGDFEKRVIVGRIACAACDTDADRHTARIARVRVCNPPAHPLAQGQGVISIDAVSDNDELLSAETIREIGHTAAAMMSRTIRLSILSPAAWPKRSLYALK